MKAILEFNLPEESVEHLLALRGDAYKYALDDMDNYLRARLKYEALSDAVAEALQEARVKLNELIRDAED